MKLSLSDCIAILYDIIDVIRDDLEKEELRGTLLSLQELEEVVQYIESFQLRVDVRVQIEGDDL